MELDSSPLLRFLIFGQLKRNFILLPDGRAQLDIPGGSAMFAAAGLAIWDGDIGINARAGEDYPRAWLARLEERNLDCAGIRILPEVLDLRAFYAYPDFDHCFTDVPVSHFARLGLPFPKALLGYNSGPIQLDSRTQPTPLTLRATEIPANYLDATAAHLCPLDYLSHSLIPAVLRQGHVTTITLDPAPGYMHPAFWDSIPALLKGISAFICAEPKLRSLFQGHSTELWEMAETLASFGCPIIVIKRGSQGQWVYDHSTHTRWIIPAYPAHIADPTGVGDAFCGGFLVGLRTTYQPLEAALMGNISASLTLEGHTPLYALDALPGLAQARLDALRTMVRKA